MVLPTGPGLSAAVTVLHKEDNAQVLPYSTCRDPVDE